MTTRTVKKLVEKVVANSLMTKLKKTANERNMAKINTTLELILKKQLQFEEGTYLDDLYGSQDLFCSTVVNTNLLMSEAFGN